MSKYVKVLKLGVYTKNKLTIGKKYKCLDNCLHTAIIDNNGDTYLISLNSHPNSDRYEVLEDES